MAFKNFFLFFMMLAVFTVATSSYAQSQPDENHVKISLIPETSELPAGGSLFFIIKQDIDEGWHTYWKNAGDSGEPPIITWKAPAGFEPQDIKWPTPKRIDIGPLTNYGYEGTVSLLQEMRIPYDVPEEPVELKATIDILVCEEICIPETHEASVTLNDGSAIDNAQMVTDVFNVLPYEMNWDAVYKENEQGQFALDLNFEQPAIVTDGNDNVFMDIVPYEWGVIDNPSRTSMTPLKDKRVLLKKKRGDRSLKDIGSFQTLIIYDVAGQDNYGAIEVTAYPDPQWLAALETATDTEESPESSPQKKSSGSANTVNSIENLGLLTAIFFALLGGLILNLMPCVFPVLSMKTLSLVQMAGKSPAATRMHGIMYTAGIMSSFAAIAGLLIILQSAGAQIGWGFQLQNPLIVLLLAYLLFMIGLNLSGFYEIKGSFTNVGAGRGQKEGTVESFLTGVLATIVATPCTAPFMGVAMGFALTQGTVITLIVFLALGLGLALPYLLLSFFPALRAILPKPGNWMIVLRELLAFPMYASVVWLIWVYSQQAGALGLLYALSGFVGISFAVWVFRYTPKENAGRWALRGLAIIVLLTVLSMAVTESLQTKPTTVQTQPDETAFWQPFTQERFTETETGNDPVFVNMTAAWCITCKVNERIALNIDSTKKLFDDKNIQYLKGDWTNQNPEITAYLERYGRSGVPLYVYYGPRNPKTGQRPEPHILPQILTPGIVADVINGT